MAEGGRTNDLTGFRWRLDRAYHVLPQLRLSKVSTVKRFLIPLVALALGATACSGGTAAIVDGESISTEFVASLLAGSEAPATDQFNDMLYQVIVDRVIAPAAAAEFDIDIDQAAIDIGVTQLEATLAAQGIALDDALVEAGFSAEVLPIIVRQDQVQTTLNEVFRAAADEPTEAEIQESFDLISAQLGDQVCAAHILLETEEEAVVAYDRVVAGEDFAEVAIELSTGPSGPNGGDLGCAAASGYVGEFAEAARAAEIGVPTEPVQTEFGFHVILVNDRPVPTIDEYRDQIVEQLVTESSSAAITEWYRVKLRGADVEVAETYGVWDVPEDETQLPSIVAP